MNTLLSYITNPKPTTTLIFVGVVVSVAVFIFAVLKDKRDDREDDESLHHSKSIKMGVLSIVIGVMILIGIDFSGGIELILTGFSVIFLRQSIHRLRK